MVKYFDIPVLLLTFNRSETLKEVIKSLKTVKPQKIYIVSDGPRNNKEKNDVDSVRKLIDISIDWDCEVLKKYRSSNLGCKNSIKDGIDWFFEHEELGIILEDDTVPEYTFYQYCSELLIKYRYDDRVGMISGNNHINYMPDSGNSYVFSKFAFTWGWCTWRRAWRNMDLEMNWAVNRFNDVVTSMTYTEKLSYHWLNNYNSIISNKVSAWDYQWFFSLVSQNQLCIFPKINLVRNIGVNNGTHVARFKKIYSISSNIDFPLVHPNILIPEQTFEKKYEREMIYIPPLYKRLLPKKIKKILKLFLKR